MAKKKDQLNNVWLWNSFLLCNVIKYFFDTEVERHCDKTFWQLISHSLNKFVSFSYTAPENISHSFGLKACKKEMLVM